jgi:hypothetical protein
MTSRLLVLVLVSLSLGCPGPSDPPTDTGPGTDVGAPVDGGGIDAGTDGGAGPTDAPTVGAAPVVTINHPGDGEDRQVGVDVPMVGVASDAEDGTFADADLVWTSDVEGAIGTGDTWTWTPTTTGAQVITLTVTDSDGNVASDSVSLNITP